PHNVVRSRYTGSGGVLVFANDTAARLVPVKSYARNKIETVFCLRRNHIWASALNATSQQKTNVRRVACKAVPNKSWGQKRSGYETSRPMSRKTRIRCPRP